ncbi:MAG TPA: response regulator [Polyangiaceae bacterium]|nr:response regulator [Polyangiaceae bacterium]
MTDPGLLRHLPDLPAPGGVRRGLVWLVEDSPTQAEVMRRALAGEHDVEIFSDGASVLERAAAGPGPDVLVLDWQLPGASGIEVLRFLRQSHDETVLPVLMLTVQSSKADLAEGLAAGANDYVGKPFDPIELRARVRTLARIKWLHERAARDEQAVREREAQLRLALEASSTGLWVWDSADDGVGWSPEVFAIVGVAEGGFDGTTEGFFRLVHPDDRARVGAAVRGAIEGGYHYECEFRVVRPDGEVVWVQNRGRAVYGEGGAVRRMLGTITDVTQRRRAEAALEARERELRTLTDHSPDVLTRFDRDLRHVFVNAAVERAAGRPRGEFLGKTNRELGMPGELCDLWEGATREVFATGERRLLEFSFGPEGAERHYAAWLVPEVGPGGGVEHVLGVTHDVTERKLAERALRAADERKDEFLATLAHELRSPLAPLRTGLEVVKMSRGGAGADKALGVMERQLGHLVRLVDDLLDVARISRGKVELRRERIEVRAVLDHAVEVSRPLVEAARHALDVRAPGEPLWLDGDLTRLAQVVSNLLNNAAKYTPDGGRIELSARAEGGEAVIRVSDNGAGISAEMLPRVFDLFAQVDRTRDRAQGGLGIGLSLVRRLVELHGGAIEAKSEGLGRGSSFEVRLPLVRPAEGRAEAPSGAARGGERPGGWRILVVDDNADGAELLAMTLELSGHLTRVAYDGPGALEAAEAFRPEVIFLDIGLPGLDGYEVARRLRAEPALAGAALVALTGWGAQGDKQRALDAGFDVHLTKPVDRAEVEGVLGRLSAARPGVG